MDSNKVIVSKKFNFKKFFKKLFKKTKKIILLLIDKFKSLDKLYQRIIYCWCGLIVLLIIMLIVLGNKSRNLDEYYKWETYLEESAIQYAIDEEIYPSGKNPMILTSDALESEKVISGSYVPDSTCLSYVKLYYSYDMDGENGEGEYVAKAYINCKKYTTPGYSDNK